MRPAWQGHNRNFDAELLTFWSAAGGFVLGESRLGEDKLGEASEEFELVGEFTAVSFDAPTTVEAGLWVHREVQTCQITATLPDKRDLKGKPLIVRYAGQELFRGRIRRFKMTEQVDIGREHLPGNTPVKTYRVTLLGTTGEEKLATTATPARSFLAATSIETRLQSWTARTATTEPAAVDLPVNIDNVGWEDTVFKRIELTDAMPVLLETMREEAKLRNMTVEYRPYEDPGVILRPCNRWINGGDRSTAFLLSDEDLPTGTADDFLATSPVASYTTLNEDTDDSLWTNSVKPTYTKHAPPDPDVDVVAGPYRLSTEGAEDPEVKLGTLEWTTDPGLSVRTGRIFAATLPLKRESQAVPDGVSTPLQTTAQLEHKVPGMALLKRDGVTSEVAVLGLTHKITPDRWIVDYKLGPHHLLDRDSDLDPGTPQAGVSVIPVGGMGATLRWYTPHLPTDVTLYRRIYATGGAGVSSVTSDDSFIAQDVNLSVVAGETEGDLQEVIIDPSVFIGIWPTAVWVAYTSNPAPGSGNPSANWREGQPCFLGEVPF